MVLHPKGVESKLGKSSFDLSWASVGHGWSKWWFWTAIVVAPPLLLRTFASTFYGSLLRSRDIP